MVKIKNSTPNLGFFKSIENHNRIFRMVCRWIRDMLKLGSENKCIHLDKREERVAIPAIYERSPNPIPSKPFQFVLCNQNETTTLDQFSSITNDDIFFFVLSERLYAILHRYR